MAEIKDVITQKMVALVLSTIFCIGAAASYVEFRASKNAGEVRSELLLALNNKYNAESGLRLEILVDQQGKTIDAVIKNQNELIKLTDRINTTLEVLNSEIKHFKETK